MMNSDGYLAWADRFPESLKSLWHGVRLAAMELADGDAGQRLPATQAFLFAVGNFKRQAPIHPPSREGEKVDPTWEAPTTIELAGSIVLSVDNANTWETLTSLRGIGVPTATTALSALWPGHHAIVDLLTIQAAVGLRGLVSDWDGPVSRKEGESSAPPHFDRSRWLTWPTYAWYRKAVIATAEDNGISVQNVERAWFELIKWQFNNKPAPPDQSWIEYGHYLQRILTETD